jgi:hypothetical protein
VTEADADHFDLRVVVVDILDQVPEREDPAVAFIVDSVFASWVDDTLQMFQFLF